MRRFASNPYVYRDSLGAISTCAIEAFELDNGVFHGVLGQCVVIATELPDNQGMSVTNAAEALAANVCNAYDIDPRRLVWVERYPATDARPAGTWDLVTFACRKLKPALFADPIWRPMERADWLELGLPVPGEVANG